MPSLGCTAMQKKMEEAMERFKTQQLEEEAG